MSISDQHSASTHVKKSHGVTGQCVVVCCDRAVDVEAVGVEVMDVCADAHWRGSGLDDGDHALFTDVAVDLVVDVGVAA